MLPLGFVDDEKFFEQLRAGFRIFSENEFPYRKHNFAQQVGLLLVRRDFVLRHDDYAVLGYFARVYLDEIILVIVALNIRTGRCEKFGGCRNKCFIVCKVGGFYRIAKQVRGIK